MKKIVFILFIITILILSQKDSTYIIPNDAIRFRIIANSNRIEDQTKKLEIKKELETELSHYLKSVTSYEKANLLITDNLSKIDEIVRSKTKDYTINYGLNYFPEKKYKNVVYPQGNYNSLVITLGSGLGENWWCVLYPPLCFIDDDNLSNAEYVFFVKDIFKHLK